MTKARSNATAEAAKGDLRVGNGTNLSGILAVGSNGETIVADSSTSTGLGWQGDYAAGKNKIINGDFGVNQRQFTSTTTSGTFGFDRWFMQSVDGTTTYSAETFTPGAAPVAGYEGANFARLVSTGQTLTTAQSRITQRLENVRSCAGQTVTVSFWAKASTGTPSVALNFSQNFGSGGSTTVNITGQKTAITTSWVRYSKTFAIPSISGKTIGNSSYVNFNVWTSAGSDLNTSTDSLGIQSVTIDFWGFQIEAGSVATAFQTATGTIQGELAACQRYYWRGSAAENFAVYGSGSASSTTAVEILVPILQTMRVKPTSVDYASLFLSDGSGSPAISSITIAAYTTNTVRLNTATTGATQFRPYSLMNAGTSAGYLAFNAEL